MKKLPESSDILGWVEYLWGTVSDFFTGKNATSPDQESVDKKTNTAEIIGIVILVAVVVLCCGGAIVYMVVQFFTYSGKTIPSTDTTAKAAGPRVDDEHGVQLLSTSAL